MTAARVALFWLAFALGVLRLAGVRSEPFQAAAHLLVGGLGGAYLAGRRPYYLALAAALTLLEVVAFLAVRFGDLP